MSVLHCRRPIRNLILASFVAVSAGVAQADPWPAFRGADGQSVSAEKGFPVEWAPDKNVRWRVALPGKSNGSPIAWGDRVFIAQADSSSKRRTLMCFGRKDGALLWQSGVEYAEKEATHPDNPYCSGTPATDGERVIVSFGSAGIFCYDFAGKELWRRDLGKLDHMFGNAISPVLAGELVVMNFGPGVGTRLVALDKRTGNVAWERHPPEVDPSERMMTAERLGGPAMMLSMSFVGQGDKDDDAALTRDEMNGLADKWFDVLAPDKAPSVNAEQFGRRAGELLGGAGNRGGPDAGKVLAPKLFELSDADRDGSVSREEFRAMFAGWHEKWSGGKGEVDGNQVLDGLNTVFPPRRGAGDFGGEKGPAGSWATPVVIRANGRDELVVGFPNRLAAYDPKTGKELWFSKDLKDAVQPMPVWDATAGAVIAASGDTAGGSLVAVKPGGSGDVTESHRLWRQPRVKGSIGTGVAQGGRLYYVSSDGFAAAFDTKTGKRLWQKRLEAAGDKGSTWSSLLLADGKIYVPNQSGDVLVLRAGGEFDVLATNSVNEPTNASLAASDGDLFLRTDRALWCIGPK